MFCELKWQEIGVGEGWGGRLILHLSAYSVISSGYSSLILVPSRQSHHATISFPYSFIPTWKPKPWVQLLLWVSSPQFQLPDGGSFYMAYLVVPWAAPSLGFQFPTDDPGFWTPKSFPFLSFISLILRVICRCFISGYLIFSCF